MLIDHEVGNESVAKARRTTLKNEVEVEIDIEGVVDDGAVVMS